VTLEQREALGIDVKLVIEDRIRQLAPNLSRNPLTSKS
jgi:hypothetical protein